MGVEAIGGQLPPMDRVPGNNSSATRVRPPPSEISSIDTTPSLSYVKAPRNRPSVVPPSSLGSHVDVRR